MTSFRKKKRPLSREEKTYADDRLIIVACEDRYAPAQYFDLLPNQRIKVKTLATEDGRSNPQAIFDRLTAYKDEFDLHEFDQLWLALDTDHWASGNHKKTLANVLKVCQQQGIRVAMSNPCFDLWLLLHQTDIGQEEALASAADVAQRFREARNEFNKRRLDPTHYTASSIVEAVKRAMRLDVAPEDWFPEAPCTRIYLIVEQAVEKDFIRLDNMEG